MVTRARSPNVLLAGLLAVAACAAFTVTGCGSPERDDATVVDTTEREAPLDPVLADEAAESEDATPASDDPTLGAVVEDPADADYAPDDGLDLAEIYELDAAKRPVRVRSPVPGKKVTYPYGVKNRRYVAGYHTGDDYATPTGSNVVAVRAGTIRWSNDNGGAYGKWMGLDADNGRTYVYCHLSKRLYGAGKHVTAGQRIAKSGATGNVTGPHLHFEDHPRGPFHYAQDRKPRW